MENRLNNWMSAVWIYLLAIILLPMSANARPEPTFTFAYEFQSTVTGTVTDEDGIPLAGASIVVKGSQTGAVTDFDGNYSIEVAADGILVFSYVGFKTTEIAVDGRSTVNASLPIDAGQLEEVVVVGYGTQKKKNLTGSVGIADAERLENRPAVLSFEFGTGLVVLGQNRGRKCERKTAVTPSFEHAA